jgi:general secretion pathway protein G
VKHYVNADWDKRVKTIFIPDKITMPTDQSSLPEHELQWYQYSLRSLFILMLFVAVCSSAIVIFRHYFVQYARKSKPAAARTQVEIFEDVLETYKRDVRNYPSTKQNLNALVTRPKDLSPGANWNGPYCPPTPPDPWHRPYHYCLPGKHNLDKYDLWSSGPDGISGTEDDIGNWKEKR